MHNKPEKEMLLFCCEMNRWKKDKYNRRNNIKAEKFITVSTYLQVQYTLIYKTYICKTGKLKFSKHFINLRCT